MRGWALAAPINSWSLLEPVEHFSALSAPCSTLLSAQRERIPASCIMKTALFQQQEDRGRL